MTTEFKPGLRWARFKKHTFNKSRYNWCIVQITGHAPFFENEIVHETDGVSAGYDCITNPEEWEWGPEIEIPPEDTVNGSDVLLGVKLRKMAED